jgi:predicted Zn finger-like uncharacterized protein
MVIKCPRCSSRYKIDAAGLPEEGTYARCRKCENVFFVRKRSSEEVSRIRKSIRKRDDEGVQPVAASEAPRLPEPVFAAAEDAVAGEDEFSTQPPIVGVSEKPAPEIRFDERIETVESKTGESDIEAMLAAYSPETEETSDTMPESASGALAVESELAQMERKSAVTEPEDVEEPPLNLSADDIEALLAANSPVNRTKADEPMSLPAQDEIDDLLNQHAPKPDKTLAITPPPAKVTAKKQESASLAQDDIEALLAANAPKPTVETAAEKKQESASLAQDDIEALLAANAPKPATKAKPAPSQKEVTSGFDQNSIDALFAANSPGKDEAQTTAAASSAQDDIDSLLADNSTFAQSAKPTASAEQNEIDALLASATGKPTPKPADAQSAAPPKADGEILSQSDLDSLLSQASGTSKTATPSAPKDDEGVISATDIDSILDSAGFDEPERTSVEAEEKTKDDGLLSQDTLDSLLAEASQGDTDQPEKTPAPALSGPVDDDLEMLLAGEEDTLGEALFENSAKPTTSTGEPSLDELLAGETTPREPAPKSGHDDDDFAGAMPGVFARGEASFSSVEEDNDAQAPVKKKGFSPAALFAPVISALKKAMGKLPIPKFKFVGAIFHKLPPRLAGVTAGLALAVVVGAVIGGWWYLKGEEPKETTQVARKEPDHKPAAKPEEHPAAPAPAQAPVPAKTPAEGQSAPKPPAHEPAVAPAKASKGKFPVSFVVYLPVEFDAEATKILNMNVELIFDSETVAKLVRERLFFSAVTVEKAIDGFFRDKFYEETVFAQDKLEEFLVQNLKSVKQFAGLQDVRLSGFTID